MEEFIEEIKAMTTEYGVEATSLNITLAIEKFRDLRNYPADWTEEKILADMQKNKSKIAMAVVELDSKDGMENQTAHSENGYNRTFFNGIMAYKEVIGFANPV